MSAKNSNFTPAYSYYPSVFHSFFYPTNTDRTPDMGQNAPNYGRFGCGSRKRRKQNKNRAPCLISSQSRRKVDTQVGNFNATW